MNHGSISADVIWIANPPARDVEVKALLLHLPYPQDLDIILSDRLEKWETVHVLSSEHRDVTQVMASDLFNLGLILGAMVIGTQTGSIYDLTNSDKLSLELRDQLSTLTIDFAGFIYSLTRPDINKRLDDPRVALQSLKGIKKKCASALKLITSSHV
jgi:hypothetical protein